MAIQATLQDDDWHIVDDSMEEPLFPVPPVQIKEEHQSPATEPPVIGEPNDDAAIKEFLDSILNIDGDFSCDFDVPNSSLGGETRKNQILPEDAELTGKQVLWRRFFLIIDEVFSRTLDLTELMLQTQFKAEDHEQSNSNVPNWNENSFPRDSDVPSSQSTFCENNQTGYMRVSEDQAGTEDGAIFATGIRIRPRALQAPPPSLDPSTQGTARRRMHLQRKLQIGRTSYSMQFMKPHCDGVEDPSLKSEITEVGRFRLP